MEYKTGFCKSKKIRESKKNPVARTGSAEVALLDSRVYLSGIICFLKYFCLFSYKVVWNNL